MAEEVEATRPPLAEEVAPTLALQPQTTARMLRSMLQRAADATHPGAQAQAGAQVVRMVTTARVIMEEFVRWTNAAAELGAAQAELSRAKKRLRSATAKLVAARVRSRRAAKRLRAARQEMARAPAEQGGAP